MPKSLPQHQAVKRKRLLLAGADRSRQDISTLLNAMGWACTAVSRPEDVLSAIQGDCFDAVLLDFSCASASVERIVLGIRDIEPSLSDKIAVISSGAANSEISELIERYDLVSLSPDNVLSRLWITLEDLVASPKWRKQLPRGPQIARLRFDSFLTPVQAGVRSSDTSGRHFSYEHNNTIIDVQVDAQPASKQISLVGQVLDASKARRKNDHLSVVLTGPTGTLARTTTNQSGEFHLQFEFAEDVSLEIRLAERSWVSVPLVRMNGLGKNAC
jgi:hypothetical protein